MSDFATRGAVPGHTGNPSASAARSSDQREADWQRCFAHLNAAYGKHQGRGQDVFLYLMADGRGNPGVDRLLALVPELRYTSLWRGTEIECYTDIAPYLIALDRWEIENERSLQYRLARRLWREATVPMLTWLWSPHDLDSLASHYRRYTAYSLPGRQAYYLHFYDNRIIERLRRVWTEEETRQFIAPCFEIEYRDRSFNDVAWENTDSPMLPAGDEPMQLTVEQHQLLIDLARAEKLTLQLRMQCGASADHLTSSELHALVCRQLERARQYRINDEAALLNFVTSGVLISPVFDEHPVVRERLVSASRGEMSPTDALEGITDDVWRVVRQGANNA
jgi:hypothetical protein